MSETSLALFPLGRAVVPGATLKLQLFEQRYLRLVRDCMESRRGFGVVGLQSGGEVLIDEKADEIVDAKVDSEIESRTESKADTEFYQAGCLVQIEDWDQLQNGLLGITIRAEQRFLIKSLSQQEDGLWMAEVEWLKDESQASLDSQYQGLVDLYHSLAKHSGAPLNPVEDAANLGWAVASLLPIGNDDFAELLIENNPLERLRLLAEKIDQLALK